MIIPPCVGAPVYHHRAPAMHPASAGATTATMTKWAFSFNLFRLLVSLASNTLQWIIAMQHPTSNNMQSMYNFAILVLGTGSLLLSWSAKHDAWSWFKLGIESVAAVVGIVLDVMTYPSYIYAAIPFWIVCFVILFRESQTTVVKRQVIGAVTDLMSIVIQIVGFFIYPNWEYSRYEAHSAVLGGVSTLCSIVEAFGAVDTFLVVATVLAQWVYAGLIYWRMRNQMQGSALETAGVGITSPTAGALSPTIMN